MLRPDYVFRHLHITHWEGNLNIDTSKIVQEVKQAIQDEGGATVSSDAIVRTVTSPLNNNVFWLDPSDGVLKYHNGSGWVQADQDIKADWNDTDW